MKHTGDECHGKVCPDHYAVIPHIHYVDAITGAYDGYYDFNTGRGCLGPCTDWLACGLICVVISTDYGTAWAGQWYQRIFYIA